MTDSCEIDDFDDYEDFEIDEENIGQPAPRRRTRSESEKKSMEEIAKARAMQTRQRRILRRATSEQHLNEVLDWHFEDGAAYHVISAGDIDFMTFMRVVVKQHPLEYALFSTWCMCINGKPLTEFLKDLFEKILGNKTLKITRREG